MSLSAVKSETLRDAVAPSTTAAVLPLKIKRPDYIRERLVPIFGRCASRLLPPLVMIVLLLTGFALYGEGAGIQSGWYSVFGWVFLVLGDSMTVHTWHHVAMWVVILFSLIHMYMAIREDMTHRQTTVSSMVSGWRFFR